MHEPDSFNKFSYPLCKLIRQFYISIESIFPEYVDKKNVLFSILHFNNIEYSVLKNGTLSLSDCDQLQKLHFHLLYKQMQGQFNDFYWHKLSLCIRDLNLFK